MRSKTKLITASVIFISACSIGTQKAATEDAKPIILLTQGAQALALHYRARVTALGDEQREDLASRVTADLTSAHHPDERSKTRRGDLRSDRIRVERNCVIGVGGRVFQRPFP